MMQSNAVVVPMDDSHVAQIADIEKLCFSAPWSANSIARELTNPLSDWLVAMDGQRVIGYIGAQSVLGEADMMNVAVLPEYRRKGIAWQLIGQLIECLHQKKIRCITLEVRASNDPAITMYHKLGFEQVGRRPGYYFAPKEDALILRKEWEV